MGGPAEQQLTHTPTPLSRPEPQITVLDAGGQYCHLIARKVRDLGVYAEVRPSDTPAEELSGRRGIIISGGPASVYEAGSPTIDPGILTLGPGVLGICYGLQLIAQALGGAVRKGDKGEYGLARLRPLRAHKLLEGVNGGESQVWMSHRDRVEAAPEDFDVLASTETCAIAAMAHRERPVAAVQFHPEVVHTEHGREILTNFVFGMCGCEPNWDPKNRIPFIEADIREKAAGRNVFFFVSGGVDSTVAYKLCLRALGPEHVYGIYVDTGLMREGETDYVRRLFAQLGATAFRVEDASASFLQRLAGLTEPEDKRKAIGEEFVAVQDRVLRTEHFLDASWVLGQGTIYPDTIESGGTKNADLIKTHHNRVAGIQQLIADGRLVEPLSSFYKDEVREIGRELGIPEEFLSRHPFPGPGLAIRCLCSASQHKIADHGGCWLVPVRTVGVQGDSRTYRGVLAFDELIPEDRATELVNQSTEVNRVIGRLGGHVPVASMRVTQGFITLDRLARLRRADAMVRELTHASGFDHEVWQLPVVLMPLGTGDLPDSVVLRPIHSVDGMTAQVVIMPQELRREITKRLLDVEGVCAVFYDLTHKPPGTIEWE
ncbi:MAG TPA: glutamine-hydrolyzing GMP synthase [Bryobacteraceae bacterium]|nr:glutamine-hydrolyzing GMP synthase [Bryobacteraceae bacterium]